MPYFDFFWTDDIVAHIAEHGITPEEFEAVVMRPGDVRRSRSSDLPAAFGYTEDGRYIIAIYDFIDEVTVLPVTAYEVPEPR